MLIDLSNVSTDYGLAESAWSTDGSVISGPIAVDIALFRNFQCVEEKGIDLLRFYFDLRDALVQVVLRELTSFVRIEYEVVFSLSPLSEGEHILEVIFPHTFGQEPIRALRLTMRSVREMLQIVEACIREQLHPFRYSILAAFEKNQSERLFDVLRIIDQDVELSSET